jgi:Uncharacterized protein conserved in bacteria (DUF2188)
MANAPGNDRGGSQMPDVHVVPLASHWACEIDGDIRSIHKTQDEAIEHGRLLAEDQNSELRVHGQNGSIGEKDEHEDEPRDVPG